MDTLYLMCSRYTQNMGHFKTLQKYTFLYIHAKNDSRLVVSEKIFLVILRTEMTYQKENRSKKL